MTTKLIRPPLLKPPRSALSLRAAHLALDKDRPIKDTRAPVTGSEDRSLAVGAAISANGAAAKTRMLVNTLLIVLMCIKSRHEPSIDRNRALAPGDRDATVSAVGDAESVDAAVADVAAVHGDGDGAAGKEGGVLGCGGGGGEGNGGQGGEGGELHGELHGDFGGGLED